MGECGSPALDLYLSDGARELKKDKLFRFWTLFSASVSLGAGGVGIRMGWGGGWGLGSGVGGGDGGEGDGV
ncbi:hypothetical protein Tco_1029822 [Tanacetum coccineum]|uniref:Uncharacterized protein n=1 Tax=Tanacetum coccineum TaxID=301880 RepID=A0ABQ5G4S0_9ASTR